MRCSTGVTCSSTALLVPCIAFAIDWLVNILEIAPAMAPFGVLLLVYFLYLLFGRFFVKRLILRNRRVNVSAGEICASGWAIPARRACRQYGTGAQYHVDYIRNGVANIYIGSPSLTVRLWAGAGLPDLLVRFGSPRRAHLRGDRIG